MGWVIKYYFQDGLVSVMAVSNELRRAGWPKDRPPFQPENWDRWELAFSGCEDCG